ncbi:MAG: response regulator [Candidatus Binatia bacterium]
MRLLVADDDASIRKLLALVLGRAGHCVLQAQDGEQALDLAFDTRPDVIVLDRVMPGLDGVEVARRLKSDCRTKDIPIVLLSGDEVEVPPDPETGRVVPPFDVFIAKPFKVDELEAALAQLASKAGPAEAEGEESADDSVTQPQEGGSDEVGSLRLEYASSLASKISELSAFIDSHRGGMAERDELRSIWRLLHQLQGSAPAFGFAELGQCAARAATLVKCCLEEGAGLSDAGSRYLDTLVGDMRKQLDSLEREPQANAAPASSGEREAEAPQLSGAVESPPRLLLVHDDPEYAKGVSALARQRGYRLETFHNAEPALQRLREADFRVITLQQQAVCGQDFRSLLEVRRAAGEAAVLILGGNATTEARVAAVKAGADRFVEGDHDPDALAELWRELIALKAAAAGTVMVVDDDPAICSFISKTLGARGCQVSSSPGGEGLFDKLAAINPDILLLDVDMPDTDGFEITRALRSSDRWRQLAIMIMTSLTGSDSRLQAYECGADDFIDKPILPAELAVRVLGRLERERLKRASFERDRLTGLYNHECFMERARTLLDQRRDAEAPCAIATIEIARLVDFVHRYGLDAGERVVRAVADQLRIALGSTSHITGRLSGAVFSVMQLDAYEEELAVRLEGCIALLAADKRLSPDGNLTDAVGLDVCVMELSPCDELTSAIDKAVSTARTRKRFRIARGKELVSGTNTEVFIVDDDEDLSGLLEYALSNRGIRCRVIGNGAKAIETLLDEYTDGTRPVVLLDVDLPELDGFSIIERLQERRPGAFQVMMMTSHGSEREQLRGLKASAVDYLVKPLNLEVVIEKVCNRVQAGSEN